MKTKRLIDGKGRRLHILDVSVSSDWRSRVPWSDKGKPLPYFFFRRTYAKIAVVKSLGIGPFLLRWAHVT